MRPFTFLRPLTGTRPEWRLGHENAAVTHRYLRRIAPVELVSAMRARE